MGEIGENYATMGNISPSKKRNDVGANQNRAETGIKGYGKGGGGERLNLLFPYERG